MPEPTHLICMGVNYRTAPVVLRERVAVSKRQLPEALTALHALPEVAECVLLSTCNRMELYVWSPRPCFDALLRHLAGQGASLPDDCFYRFADDEALEHLACVAAGLDSLVLGETEIFGQLKDAYAAALAAGTTGRCSNRTFQRVFTIGKRVRSNTRITSGPTSIGAVAVQVAQNILGSLERRNILVVGAGEVARTTTQSLHSRGAESIFVANRSYERAMALAAEVGGRVIRFSEWLPYLEHIDIVIVSTASPVYVISPKKLESVQKRRRRPLFLIDLSVPRNVDPSCAEVEQVYVYNMDAMEKATEATRTARLGELSVGLKLVRDWVAEQADDLLQREPAERSGAASA